MTTYYLYHLRDPEYRLFIHNFPNYEQRNEEYIIFEGSMSVYLDPPRDINRRRINVTSNNDIRHIIVRSGEADRDLMRWFIHNDLRLIPPLTVYIS